MKKHRENSLSWLIGMRNLEENSRASPFLIKEEIRIVKGVTCLNCYYCRLDGGCILKNKCKLKIDEIYKKIEIIDTQLKLEL